MKRSLVLICCIFFLCSCDNKELKCDKGELIEGKCVVLVSEDALLACKEGYTFNEESKKCSNTLKIPAKTVSKCPNGFEIGNDNWCFSEEEYDMVTKSECVSKDIKEGDTFSTTYVENNKCFLKLCNKVSEDGKKCEEFKTSEIKFTTSQVCPKDNMKKVDGKCRKKYWMTKKISCEIGVLEGKQCIVEDTIDQEYTCKKDYKFNQENKKCEKIFYYEPIK